MKKQFSKHWKASKQPRKQRKYLANAPIHLRKKFLSVNLSKELRKKYSIRNITLKKGDKVKILRGKYKKKEGKINEVFYKISKVCVEGIQVKKQDGSKANVKIDSSNLQIIELNLEDSRRRKIFSQISSKKKEDQNKTDKKEDKPKTREMEKK